MLHLYYILDPMCSWCYAFSQTVDSIIPQLPADSKLYYVMGGLASDSNEAMPHETQQYVQDAWRAVSAKTGVQFNFNFWTQCHPRRSTYPACRAVIAAGLQAKKKAPNMIKAIQAAYYRQARNPSNKTTLVELAAEIGLDVEAFSNALNSEFVETLLQRDFAFRNRLGIQGFPALVLKKDEQFYRLSTGYTEPDIILQRLSMAA